MTLLDKIISCVDLDRPGIFTFVNPYSYGVLRKSGIDVSVFSGVMVDGISLVFFLKVLGFRVRRKSFDMTSVAPEVFSYAVSRGLKVCLVGSSEDEIQIAANKLLKQYSGLRLTAVRNGYFCGEEREFFLRRLVGDPPDIVVAGMGTPLQEEFLVDLWNFGWRGLGFTCGGFLHQTASASHVNYYPHWVDALNLRWAYRIIDEPKLARRYLVDYPKNVGYVLYDFFRRK